MSAPGPVSISPKTSHPHKRKQRSWTFRVSGINANGPTITYADVLAAFSERYTALKRLVISPASGVSTGNINTWRDARVVVDFRGPTPGSGPGKNLCQLLNGTSVETEPAVAGRGRKNARDRPGGIPTDASDSDSDCVGTKKMKFTGINDDLTETQVGEDAACSPSVQAISSFNSVSGGSGIILQTAAPTSPANCSPPPSTSGFNQAPVELPNPIYTYPSNKEPMQWDDLLSRIDLPANTPSLPDQPLFMGDINLSNGHGTTGSSETVQSNIVHPPLLPASEELGGEEAWAAGELDDELGAHSINAASALEWGWPSSSVLGLENSGLCGSIQIEGDGGQSSNIVADCSGQENVSPLQVGWGVTLGLANAAAGIGWAGGLDASSTSSSSSASTTHLPEVVEPTKFVTVEPVQKECNFEGNPLNLATSLASSSESSTAHESLLAFTGLDNVGQALSSLTVSAHFMVDSKHQVSKIGNPVQMGPMERVYAAVFYPSMKELWSELYNATNVGTVEVDMIIEVLSMDGRFHFVAPKLKVTYRREPDSGTGQ